jgi:ketosteroid isomerase-like protein
MLASLAGWPAVAAPADDLRATFERFIAAQNAHDAKAVGDLLMEPPTFLWITQGAAVWGRLEALKRFEALYAGTWKLEPVMAELRFTVVTPEMAQLYVPIDFTIGSAGQPAKIIRFLMNQTLVKTADGWKVASILPIPALSPQTAK